MRSKRTQKPSSIGTDRFVPNGREPHDKAILLRGEGTLGRNGDCLPLRDDNGRPAHSDRLTEDITERKQAERAIKIVPMTVLAGLAALAALLALGGLELVLEQVLSDAVALSVPVIFGSIAAAGITYLALRKQGALYSRTLEEIRERERAEGARREAERKYRDIFENAVEGIFQTSPDGGFITANPALARMLGFETPEDLIRARDREGTYYVHPERRLEFKRLLDQHDTVRGFELEAYRKDRVKIWMSDNVRAVRDASGKLLYYEGTVEDITERKRAEAHSSAFGTLARKLSGALTPLDAGRIIAATARDLFGWDSCNLDLYDAECDLVYPMLNVDTINGREVEVTQFVAELKPTTRSKRVIDHGPQLILRKEPVCFEEGAVPFGDRSRPSASIATVPICHASKVIGLLSIQSYTLQAYDDAALEDLQSLADHCGEALNRIRAEAALRDSEERYRDLVENSRELICTHDLKGLILSANPAAAAAVGYDLDGLVRKKTIRDLLAPEVRDQFDQYMARLRKERTTSGIMLVQTRSGERRIWEYYNSLRTEGVAAPIVRGMARDITEQKSAEAALRDSEERYRELFENDKDAIYVHDLNGIYRSVNRAAERLSGYPREEILGRHFREFVSPECLWQVGESFGKKLEETGETNYEVEIITRDGTHVPVEVSSRLIYENGVAIGVQGNARDITERKRAQEALLTYSRRLLEAQEAERGRIARELHDQIGQMLTALKLNLHAIQSARDEGEASLLIDDNLEMLEEALEQVRDLSVDLRPMLLDDLGLVTALRWYVDHQAQRTGVRAEFTSDSLDPDLRFSSELETACFRIAQEALTNVARHARAKTVSVRLSRSRDYLILLVEDDGVGFDVQALQGHALANATLGLRGMQERAHAVGGRLKIDSANNEGTQLFVKLPIAMPNGRTPKIRKEYRTKT
jgi:PAS domain S-box-containing protein